MSFSALSLQVSRAALVGAALLATVACKSGPKDGPINKVYEDSLAIGNETLEDKSYYREYIVSIPKDYDVNVKMVTDAFDSYIIVIPPDGSQQRENDDCDSEDPTAGSCLNFVTHVDGRWRFLANSYDVGETGDFKLTIDAAKP